jgi:zinc transport system substrate-binding protein
MKKTVFVILMSLLIISCGKPEPTGKKIIVTTIFPLYDFIRNIKSDNFEVHLLLPPGAEIHSFDPSPNDMVSIAKADLFVYIGEELEPWAKDLVAAAGLKKEKVFSVMREIPLPQDSREQSTEHKADDGHDHAGDPHIWLDFSTDILIVNALARHMTEIDGKSGPEVLKKAADYAGRLDGLDKEYLAMVSEAKRKTVIFAGHNAFGAFARRYGIEFVSPYQGFAPDAEPSLMKIDELLNAIRLSGAPVLYYEELIVPKLAEVLSKESGVKMVLLNAAHNIGKDEVLDGCGFIEYMRQDLLALKEGLY